MNFNHVNCEIPSLDRETIDGVRYYKVPDPNSSEVFKLVSITSVSVTTTKISLLSGERELVKQRQIQSPEKQLVAEQTFIRWLKIILTI